MPNTLVTAFTALVHVPPILVAGVLALLGLLLWSAGVKVARAVAAAVMGACMAGVGWGLLPQFWGLAPEYGALMGLVVGVVIGALALRGLQAMVLALALAIAASGGYYAWQANRWVEKPIAHAHAAAAPARTVSGGPLAIQASTPVAVLTQAAKVKADEVNALWLTIPGGLRQSMIVIGGGVLVLVLLLSWQVPRHTTWLVTAAGGAVLLLAGIIGMVALGAPAQMKAVPAPHVLAAIAAAVAAAGMLVQRMFFWPGKRQSEERAKDRSGETVPAV
jgi:hypothetical protein